MDYNLQYSRHVRNNLASNSSYERVWHLKINNGEIKLSTIKINVTLDIVDYLIFGVINWNVCQFVSRRKFNTDWVKR